MVAPATLALGSCTGGFSGLTTSQTDRLCLPKRSSHCFPRRNNTLLLLRNNQPPLPSLSLTRAVAVDSDQLGSSSHAEQEKGRRSNKYYFLVANAKFMLDEEEHFQELLFEKLRNYGERNKEHDFWLVVEPKFLDKFPNITSRLNRPAVALVSTNATWITFMKLRLDRVLSENFEADSLEEALASNPVDLKFEKPENWVAPYPKYEFGWWEPFLPPGGSSKTAA